MTQMPKENLDPGRRLKNGQSEGLKIYVFSGNQATEKDGPAYETL